VTDFNDRVYSAAVEPRGMNIDAVRRQLHLSWSDYRGVRETFKYGHTDHSYWFMTGVQWAEVNQITYYQKDVESLEKDIEFFWNAKQVHMVQLGGAALDMADILVKKGYAQDDIMPLMAYSLSDEDLVFELGEGQKLAKVESEKELDSAALVLSQGFDFPVEIAQKGVRYGHGRTEVSRYILLDSGVPVSTALLSSQGKSVGCFEITTPPQFQKKGYGFSLVKSIFAERAKMGDELLLLQSSAAGEPLYRKAGFKVIDYTQGWSIHDPAHFEEA